mmetsp:Transcript_14/g.45  ORF Transcript_14/g.45 Transcript_14/m.45 type:complete len:203 (-) Transcript_14:232-840(-)
MRRVEGCLLVEAPAEGVGYVLADVQERRLPSAQHKVEVAAEVAPARHKVAHGLHRVPSCIAVNQAVEDDELADARAETQPEGEVRLSLGLEVEFRLLRLHRVHLVLETLADKPCQNRRQRSRQLLFHRRRVQIHDVVKAEDLLRTHQRRERLVPRKAPFLAQEVELRLIDRLRLPLLRLLLQNLRERLVQVLELARRRWGAR